MQSDNLILCDTFKSLENMFLEMYDFDSTQFLSPLRLP